MAVNDIFELTLLGHTSGGLHQANTFHFEQQSGSGGTIDDINQLADAFDTTFLAALTALVSVDQYYDVLRIRQVDPTTSASFEIGVTNTQGSVAEVMIPPDHGVDIRWYSATLTKKGRGRNRFTGLPVTYQHGGVVTSDIYNTWLVLAGLLVNVLTAAGGNTYQLTIWTAATGISHPVTAERVQARLSSIRSRTERTSV